MKKAGYIFLPIAILVAGGLLMFLFLGMREESPRRTPSPRPRMVATQLVELKPTEAHIYAFGTLSSAQPVELYSEAKGTIEPGTVPFRPAQRFNKGDILLKIDPRQAELDRQSAVSELMAALANVLPEIKTDFPDKYPNWQTYFNNLSFDNYLPELPEVSNQKIKLYLSRFNVYKLFFTVKDLEIKLDKHIIRAPFDGSIVSAPLRAGSTARDGSLLGSIINLEDLEVELSVPANEVDWIDFNRPATLTSSEFDGTWSGKIKRVGSTIETRTQTVPLYLELTDIPTGGMFEGAFYEADMPGQRIDNSLEIPRAAIYDKNFVYVVNNGQLEYREVNIARTQKYSVIVDGGLNNGDTLVIEPLQGVTDGMPAVARMQPTSSGGM